MKYSAIERRVLTLVLGSYVDPSAPGFTVDPGEVDLFAGAMIMYRASALPARIGMRVVPWLLMLAPLFVHGRLALLSSLPATERAALLAKMAQSGSFAQRGMAVLMKLTLSMALFRAPSLRAKTGFDRPRRSASASLPLLPVASQEAA